MMVGKVIKVNATKVILCQLGIHMIIWSTIRQPFNVNNFEFKFVIPIIILIIVKLLTYHKYYNIRNLYVCYTLLKYETCVNL